MRITNKQWANYINILRTLDDKAANEMTAYINQLRRQRVEGQELSNRLIGRAYALATKYGEGAAAAACDMYDAIAALQGATVPAAMPAKTATGAEVAKTINGTLKTGNDEIVSASVGRLVKLAGVDTMQQNALRDGAEWAWIPMGDTCAFCITLASRGWQKASRNAIKNGHAEHIHANCDCTYAIRFSKDLDVEGYDPERYREMYYGAEGDTPMDRINSLRREFYARDKALGGEVNITPNQSKPIKFLTEKELTDESEKWFNSLSLQEQGQTVVFDGYNFTRDPGREKDTKVLEEAISKYELKGPIKTYRGVEEEEFFDMMFNYGENGLTTNEIKGTSISEDRAKAFAKTRGGWLFEYDINPGHNGAYFDGGVPGSNEKQFVINRNVKYKVKSVDQKGKRIIIEVG